MEELFLSNFDNKKATAKLKHYFSIYEEQFEKYKDKPINFFEIGINKGGDLQIWHKYFTKLNKIYAADINENCKSLEKILPNTTVFIGDQGNNSFLEMLSNNVEDIDILLDDGGHQFHQQINSFKILFKKIKDDGLYLIEDTHSSYDNYANLYPKDNVYGGGIGKKNTTIEFFKNLVDELTAWAYIKEHGVCPESGVPLANTWFEFIKKYNLKETEMDYFRQNIHSITFYDSIIAIKKKSKIMPTIVNTNINEYYENRFITEEGKKNIKM